MNVKKLALTAGAVGALGLAGSFGTFAAFTAQETTTPAVSSGTISVQNEFQLPSLSNLGTRDTTYTCDGTTGLPTGSSECHNGPAGKNAGFIKVKNNGTLAQDVYLDFDGVSSTPAAPTAANANVLAENIIIDSAGDADFTTPGDRATRLWMVNRRGPSKVMTLAPGQEQTMYFRAWLRERPASEIGGDNGLQGKQLTDQKVTVAAVEVDRNDLQIPTFTYGGKENNWDFGL